jgi:hypothetical protein
MAQHYSNPKRENDPHALPDIETFTHLDVEMDPEHYHGPGWYWWSCFPGCLPDSDPVGPFETEEAALADAREGMDDGGNDE